MSPSAGWLNVAYWALLVGTLVCAGYLLVIACVYPYTDFITKRPLAFLAEMLLVATLSCIPIAIMMYHRNSTFGQGCLVVLILWIKLIVLHVVFEVSGFYEWAFRAKLAQN